MSKARRILRHWCGDTRGVAMVEFAIIVALFLTIVFGIIDMGHALYMKAVVTNASREGARYGIRYQADASSHRIPPSNFSPSISNYVKNTYLSQTFMPPDANPEVTAGGTGYDTGTSGAPLQVTVTAVKTWFVLDNFIPKLGNSKTLSATTVMQCE